MAVKTQPTHDSSVPSALKVAERPERGVVPPNALKVATGRTSRRKQSTPTKQSCQISRVNTMSSVVGEDSDRQVAVISPVRPPVTKRLRLELTKVDTTQPTSATKPTVKRTEPATTSRRIPTVEWVSRATKEQSVKNGQACRLCQFETSKRRIRIHVRQHFCMHFCQCGFRHLSRDQVADHQRTTRRPGHARESCTVYMVAEDQYAAFSREMGWPQESNFGPLLPITVPKSPIDVDPSPV